MKNPFKKKPKIRVEFRENGDPFKLWYTREFDDLSQVPHQWDFFDYDDGHVRFFGQVAFRHVTVDYQKRIVVSLYVDRPMFTNHFPDIVFREGHSFKLPRV